MLLGKEFFLAQEEVQHHFDLDLCLLSLEASPGLEAPRQGRPVPAGGSQAPVPESRFRFAELKALGRRRNIMLRYRTGVQRTPEPGRTSEDSWHPEREERTAEVGFWFGLLSGQQDGAGEAAKQGFGFSWRPSQTVPSGSSELDLHPSCPLEAKGLCDPMSASRWSGVWGSR